MIRWTFFFEEGNIKSDVKEEAEDVRISEFILEQPRGLLYLPGDKVDIYLNLAMVKCTVREADAQDIVQVAPEAPASAT